MNKVSKPTKKLFELVEAFNGLYPVGTILLVEDDFGSKNKRKLLSKAWILGNHSAVAKFEGIKGCYDIKRVHHVMTYKTNPLGMTYKVPSDANGKELENESSN